MPSMDFENVTYINIQKAGSNSLTNPVYCDVTEKYNQIILDPSNTEYYLSLERLTVPCQSIPFVPQIDNAITITGQDENDNILPITLNVKTKLVNIFSLHEFIEELNAYAPNYIIFKLLSSGRIQMKCVAATGFPYTIGFPFTITISTELQRILDFNTNTHTFTMNDMEIVPPNDTVMSNSSILNRIDTLKRIFITSPNLTTQSELNGQIPMRELTSLDYSTSYSVSQPTNTKLGFDSGGTFTAQPRQDLTLSPSYPRFIKLRGAPILEITIEARAEVVDLVTGQTVLKPIALKGNSVFNCKLAFWLKRQ